MMSPSGGVSAVAPVAAELVCTLYETVLLLADEDTLEAIACNTGTAFTGMIKIKKESNNANRSGDIL